MEVEVELLLLEPPPPLELVVLEALALWEAAEVPEVPDNTLLEDDREEVEVVPDKLLLDRFNTPEEMALSDEPLLLEVGDNRLFPEEAEDPAPAPEDEPPVFEATAVGVPVLEAWM